ncbi:MAG: mechanosensitive ion channel [Gammaproteobacteria bacterium]
MRVRHWFILVVGFFVYWNSYGQASLGGLTPNASLFDSVGANKVLIEFNSPLSVQTASIHRLQQALSTLTRYELIAKKCVDQNTVQLDELNKLMAQVPTIQKKVGGAITAEQKFLESKKEQLSNQLSLCRLYLLKSQDLQVRLATQLKNSVKTQLLYAEPNILEDIKVLPLSLGDLYQGYDLQQFEALSAWSALNWNLIAVLCLLVIGSIGVAIKLKTLLHQRIGSEPEQRFYPQMRQALYGVLKRYIIYLLPMVVLAASLTLVTPLLTVYNIDLVVYILLGFVLYLSIIRFFFYPPKPAIGFFKLPPLLAKSLVHRLKLLGSLCVIMSLIAILFRDQPIPGPIVGFMNTLFITIMAINLIAVIWLVQKLPKLLYHLQFLRFVVGFILSVLLIGILFAQWYGYHLIARYLLRGISVTVLAAFTGYVIIKLIDFTLLDTRDADYGWMQRVKHWLGLKYYERLPELLWFRIALYLIIVSGFILILLRVWGVAQTGFQLFLNALFHGFRLAGIFVVPSRVLTGIILFIVLCLATRMVRTHIIKHTNPHLTQGNREALAAIAGYAGFSIAVVIALLIAGINFTGLAFIAGALTVGIGFGLQNIVSNFFSGLILLVERPVKPGDRIVVGDTEGYVRRISIRSTHLMTLQRADVIVPNSDLITKQVTNYMLYDPNYKITLTLGVAYGSDTEKVKQLLMEVAKSHPQVINQTPEQEPEVYFTRFGENSLEFELWCLVTDVNIKGRVKSDLNFRIDTVFKANGIEIAYPQREITIKNWPAKTI